MSYAFVGSGKNWTAPTLTYSMASASNLAVLLVWTSAGGGNPFLTAATTNNNGQLTPVFGSYNASGNQIADGSNFIGYWYYIPGTDASAPTSFTLTFNGGTPGSTDVIIAEYSGISSSSPLIGTVGTINIQTNPGTGTDAVKSNTQTVNTVPALILGLSQDSAGGAAFSGGTGYTQRAQQTTSGFGYSIEDLRATSAGSQQATWTNTHGAAATLVSMLLAFAEPADALMGQIIL